MEITSQQLDACIKAAIAENAIKVIDLLYEIKHGSGNTKPSTLQIEPPSPVQTFLPCDLDQGINSPASMIGQKSGYSQMKSALGLIFKGMEVGKNFSFGELATIVETSGRENPWLDHSFTPDGKIRWRDHLSNALFQWRVMGYIEKLSVRGHYKLVRPVFDF